MFATARRLDSIAELEGAGCRLLELDVTDEGSLARAVETVERDAGAVGALVNNAGYSLSGAVESVPLDEARRQFETNVFGLARLTQLVLPGMRREGWGRIVNVTSMGGKLTFPGGGWYHASKHAVEALSDALRFELQGFGIDVVVIEPGLIDTGFADAATASIPVGAEPYEAFNAAVGAATAGAYEGGFGRRLGGGPETVAAAIERALTARRPRTRYRVTPSAKLFLTLRKVLPDRGWDALVEPDVPSAEAVGAREALREDADEQRGRQADDVQVVALDPLDERGAAALDRVAAGASLPLAERQVRGEVARRQGPEGDAASSSCSTSSQPGVIRQRPETTTCVRPASASSISLGVGEVGRLAVRAPVEDDGGVDAEHGPVAGVLRHGARLAAGVVADEVDGVGAGRVVLDVVGRDDVEREAELLEDRAPLRARRGEEERRRRRRAHRLRATQISSDGQRRDHSG